MIYKYITEVKIKVAEFPLQSCIEGENIGSH
jgi:hypothetical protein